MFGLGGSQMLGWDPRLGLVLGLGFRGLGV